MLAQWNPIFNPLLQLGKYRYKIFYGGRGSGKSIAAVYALLDMGDKYKLNILCAREIQNSIADSVHKEFSEAINRFELTNWEVQRDKIINTKTGTVIIFKGLKAETMASIKSLSSIDICWVEEAHSVTNKSWKTLDPTIRAKYSEIWMTFNRETNDDPVWTRYCENPSELTYIEKVNWYDNPYFPEVLRKLKDEDYARDMDEAVHTWEGEPLVRTEALVFKRWEILRFKPPQNTVFLHGCDWGFSKDPTVIVQCFIYTNAKKEKILYISKAAGGVGIEIGGETGILFDTVLPSKKWSIIADSARPETISAMKKLYYNVKACKKGKGSVEDGVSFINSFKKVVIHPDCKGVIEEFSKYSYKVDKTTETVLPIIEDKWNHYIDALRYALEADMRVSRSKKNKHFFI